MFFEWRKYLHINIFQDKRDAKNETCARMWTDPSSTPVMSYVQCLQDDQLAVLQSVSGAREGRVGGPSCNPFVPLVLWLVRDKGVADGFDTQAIILRYNLSICFRWPATNKTFDENPYVGCAILMWYFIFVLDMIYKKMTWCCCFCKPNPES